MTLIAIPIFIADAGNAAGQIQAVVDAKADIVELRADEASLEALAVAMSAAAKHGLQTIVTIRPTWEGGRSAWDDQARLAIYQLAGQSNATYIDVELVTWESSALIRDGVRKILTGGMTKLIVSNHDFSGRPGDLEKRLERLRAVKEAHTLKLVWKAESIVCGIDALRMTGAAAGAQDARPVVALAMGEEGQISRLLAAKFGAPFTFATLAGDGGSAPGQPTIAELRGVYQWERQNAEAEVFGVAGWPVGHSMSPAIHNAGFAAAGVNAVYVPLPIQPTHAAFDGAMDALAGAAGMNFRGVSVTIPHKVNALHYVSSRGGEVDKLSRHIGAINTILLRPGERPVGLNSDYIGALNALTQAMGISVEALKDYRVAVLGAGGAASAIVAALAHSGATVVIYNRTVERAKALAGQFDGTPGKVVGMPWDALSKSCCHIYINCTPIGMHPKIDATPLPAEVKLGAGNVVFDTVYNPVQTQLLKQAQVAGAKTVAGIEMFINQAAVQFEKFTGRAAPLALFREILMKKLGS